MVYIKNTSVNLPLLRVVKQPVAVRLFVSGKARPRDVVTHDVKEGIRGVRLSGAIVRSQVSWQLVTLERVIAIGVVDCRRSGPERSRISRSFCVGSGSHGRVED